MKIFSPVKKNIKKFIADRSAAGQGLRLKAFDDWAPELDDALQVIPETEIFPHDLFRLLMKMSDPKKKQIILVTERGEPVAVAGLRNRSGYWEPVTQWIIPGVLFPVKHGYLSRVLPALGIELQIGWWRWQEDPPQIKCIRDAISEPTYGISLSEDYEKYWRETKLLRNIRTFRNRCKNFELKVNPPGGIEWTIRNWEAKWRPQGISEMPDLAERLQAAQYLQERGLLYSLLLFDRDEPAAGRTLIIHRNEVVAQVNYRNPKYDKYGAMNRLGDITFQWAQEMGFKSIDLGGSHDYKNTWAPENGRKWKFTICPGYIFFKKQASQLASSMKNKLGSFIR